MVNYYTHIFPRMLKQILSLFLKVNCPLCQRPTESIICKYCEQKLRSCGIHNHRQSQLHDLSVFVWGNYESYLKRAITSCKYDLQPEIANLLGVWLGEAWLKAQLKQKYPKLTVMPIPLHRQKLKVRGFNQAQLIANSFCQITGYRHLPHLLSRVKDTEAMFNLTPKQRIANLKQAFSVGKDYPKFKRDSQILIIDDIYTTGTTVKSAMRILSRLKIDVVGVAVIATPKI